MMIHSRPGKREAAYLERSSDTIPFVNQASTACDTSNCVLLSKDFACLFLQQWLYQICAKAIKHAKLSRGSCDRNEALNCSILLRASWSSLQK